MKTIGTIFLLLALPLLAPAQTNVPTGKVVWWGRDMIQRSYYSNHTNGVVESDDEILSNVVSIAGNTWQGLLLQNDGTVLGIGNNFRGGNDVPSGLSNVVSIAAGGGSYWAIRRDGSVARWGNEQDEGNVVPGLSNIVSVTWAGYRNYLALKTDGTVLGFRFDNPRPLVEQVKVDRQVLSNVVALAAMGYTTLVLKNDGTVFILGYQKPGKPPVQPSYEVHSNVLYEYLGAESAQLPYQYTSADPVIINGQTLSNVISLASGGGHALALKKNGIVVAWGNDTYGATSVPTGLTNVIAIAAAEHESLALKRDSTVVVWGGDYSQQLFVPAALSNVVAIASAGDFNLAITTGNIPSSVFIQPHGRLEEMEQEADLVFKGQIISDSAITNAAFPDWGKPHATEFNVISIFKGNIHTNVVTFLHITGGPGAWSGSRPPQEFIFDVGRSYLVFAMRSDKADWLYSPSTNGVAKPDEFRQIMRGEIPIRTLDNRPLNDISMKEAHWLELNLLLNDSNSTNQLYAIDKLDGMCMRGDQYEEWRRSGDFKRIAVLNALLRMITNSNDQVASRAINCFATASNPAAVLEPFADVLVKVANESPSFTCRLGAISALSGVDREAVSNSLAQLFKNPDENVRVGAVRLLPRFPDEFAEQGLQELADDQSANVRSVVADIIGDGKYERCLPVLTKLFADPVGMDKLILPTTTNYLRAGQRWNNIGDVHTAAGYALVKFAPNQVSDILKTNLDDLGFHINFVAKLAQGDAEPWLPELVSILEARRAFVDDVIKSPWDDPRRFADPQADRILIGTYAKCWEDIRQYLLKKSPEELASGKLDRYLDLLEKTVRPVSGCPGCSIQEARWLYELYRTKNLEKREADLRRQYDKTEGWWFDDFNSRGEAAQVNPITF